MFLLVFFYNFSYYGKIKAFLANRKAWIFPWD